MPRKNKPERKTTSITITREIRDRIESHKLIPDEHLNSVLKRILDIYEEVKE